MAMNRMYLLWLFFLLSVLCDDAAKDPIVIEQTLPSLNTTSDLPLNDTAPKPFMIKTTSSGEPLFVASPDLVGNPASYKSFHRATEDASLYSKVFWYSLGYGSLWDIIWQFTCNVFWTIVYVARTYIIPCSIALVAFIVIYTFEERK